MIPTETLVQSAYVSPYLSSIAKQDSNTQAAIGISKLYARNQLSLEESVSRLESLFQPGRNEINVNADPLIDYIQTTLGTTDISIQRVETERGWSDTSSYWVVRKTTREKLLFLKTFAGDDGAFLEEVFSLAYLKEMNTVSTPEIKLISRCLIDREPHYLLLETIVNGLSIQQLYNKVADSPTGTDERASDFNTLCRGVRACGRALAKLHTHISIAQTLTHKVCDDFSSKLARAVAALEAAPQEGVPTDLLKQSAAKALDRMQGENHLFGVTHGDMKLIHTFYNPQIDEISLIDPPTLARGIDPDGHPLNLPSVEYSRYIRSLKLNRIGYSLNGNGEVQRKELLTEVEENAVENHFKEGYLSGGGILPTHSETDFALLLHNLSFIINANRELPEPDLSRLKDLVAQSVECLQNRIAIDQTKNS